jgi:hypothetical protein
MTRIEKLLAVTFTIELGRKSSLILGCHAQFYHKSKSYHREVYYKTIIILFVVLDRFVQNNLYGSANSRRQGDSDTKLLRSIVSATTNPAFEDDDRSEARSIKFSYSSRTFHWLT